LAQKGFRSEEGRRDHRYWFFYHEERKTNIFTKISRGTGYRDYGIDLLNKVKRQLRFDTLEQLQDFIDCPMSGEDYARHLREKELLR